MKVKKYIILNKN